VLTPFFPFWSHHTPNRCHLASPLDPCVGDPRGTRGDSVHLPHLLPLLPTHVNKASGHAPTTYVPYKTCHSTTTPRLTQLQLPWRCLTPICSRACQYGHSQPRKFGWREVVGIPRSWSPRTSVSVCGQLNARLKCAKRGRTAQRVSYRLNPRLNGTAGGRKTQRKVDNAQCAVANARCKVERPQRQCRWLNGALTVEREGMAQMQVPAIGRQGVCPNASPCASSTSLAATASRRRFFMVLRRCSRLLLLLLAFLRHSHVFHLPRMQKRAGDGFLTAGNPYTTNT